MSELHRITSDPEICSGRPAIRGLRIRVEDVLELLASGAAHQEILEDYPLLVAADIVAALEYAARQAACTPQLADDPFAAFNEWSSDADQKAYTNL